MTYDCVRENGDVGDVFKIMYNKIEYGRNEFCNLIVSWWQDYQLADVSNAFNPNLLFSRTLVFIGIWPFLWRYSVFKIFASNADAIAEHYANTLVRKLFVGRFLRWRL